jgi:hypothetical protein
MQKIKARGYISGPIATKRAAMNDPDLAAAEDLQGTRDGVKKCRPVPLLQRRRESTARHARILARDLVRIPVWRTIRLPARQPARDIVRQPARRRGTISGKGKPAELIGKKLLQNRIWPTLPLKNGLPITSGNIRQKPWGPGKRTRLKEPLEGKTEKLYRIQQRPGFPHSKKKAPARKKVF